MTTISACIITRGEATLEAAIASVRPYVDEVVVVYTCNIIIAADAWVEEWRCAHPGDVVRWTEWEDDFAKAREASFRLATSEYVVWLDSDDVVFGAEHLRDACRPGARVVCPYQYSVDPKTGEVEVLQARERIVPNDGTFRWVHPVHETLIRADGQRPNDVADDRIVWRHVRKPGDVDRGRNLRILERYAAAHEPDAWLSLNLAFEYQNAGRPVDALRMFGAYLDVSRWPEERALACVRAGECELAAGDPFDPARVRRAVEWCRRAQKETPDRFEPLYAEAKIWAIPGMTGDEASLSNAVRAAERALRTPETRTAMATRPLDRRLRVHEMLRVAHDLACDWAGALRATEEAVKVRAADPALKLALKRYRALSKVAAVEEARGLDIVFVCGPAAEPFNPQLYEQRGMGGSETAVIEMARELAKRGHRVRVYCDCGFEGTFDGVDYLDVRAEYPPDQCDVIVAWRSYLNARFMHSAVRVVWAHDTSVVDMEKRDGRYEVAIDRVFALSEWHKANLCRVHELDPAGVWVTRNGIDVARFRPPEQKTIGGPLALRQLVDPEGLHRNPHKAIYSSSPDRGLAALLDMWPRIRAKVPDAELHVFYGFDGWDRAVEQRGNPHERYLVRQMKERLTTTPGVTFRGLVSQAVLAREMLSAGVMLYPTWYDETSMISAMEATAAGLRFIGTSRGALPETVGNRGLLIEGDWLDDDFQRQFVVAASVAMLHEDDADYRASRVALARYAREHFAWSGVAEEWEAEFVRLMADAVRRGWRAS